MNIHLNQVKPQHKTYGIARAILCHAFDDELGSAEASEEKKRK
jgi:hypothetical protein